MIQILPSKIDGLGVFTDTTIRSGFEIGEYSGPVVTWNEAREYAKGKERIAAWEFHDGYALLVGEPFKYINHSCNPNAIVLSNGGHSLIAYTMRDIYPGEEITHDYGPMTHHKGTLQCRCSPDCERML